MTDYYDKYRYLSCFEMTEDTDHWWMSDYKWNALFRVSKRKYNIEKIVDLTDKTAISEGTYSYIVCYQDKLFFLPQNSLRVAVYDKKICELTMLALNTGKKSQIYGTAGYAILGKDIYVFPSYKDCIPFVLDGETLSIRYLATWKKQVDQYGGKERWLINSAVEINGEILLGLYNRNIILKYNPQKDIYKKICLTDKNFKINKIYKEEENKKLIILSVDNDIAEFSYKQEMLFETKRWKSEIGDEDIINILMSHEELVVLPKSGRRIKIINRESSESWNIDIPMEYLLNIDRSSCKYIHGGKIDKTYIYLFPYSAKGIICINRVSKHINLIKLDIDGELLERQFDLYIEQNNNHEGVFNEQRLPLNRFLQTCVRLDQANKRSNLLVGTNILNCMLERE